MMFSFTSRWRLCWGWDKTKLRKGASQVVLMVKNPPANTGDVRDAGLTTGSGRSPGGGHRKPLQYPCLKNHTDRVAWWATVHWVAKSRTWLKRLSKLRKFKCYWRLDDYLPIYLSIISLSIYLSIEQVLSSHGTWGSLIFVPEEKMTCLVHRL